MPVFDFECKHCDKIFEYLTMSSVQYVECKDCKNVAKKIQPNPSPYTY